MKKEERKVRYLYKGYGASLLGIPARDLTEEEVQVYGEKLILSSGLYRLEEMEAENGTGN